MESGIDTIPEKAGCNDTMTREDAKSQKFFPLSEVVKIENRLADEIQLRKFTEAVLDSRQQELESQEFEKIQLSQQVESLKKELADTQRQLTEAHNATKSKDKQLQEARDQIFRLQPSRRDITEAEAQESYKALCASVQRWVENRLKPILDDLDHGKLRGQPAPTPAARFCGLVREPAKKWLTAHQSDEYHIMAAIMNYLWLALFVKSFYCPLDDNDSDATLQWFDELESTMSKQRGKQ